MRMAEKDQVEELPSICIEEYLIIVELLEYIMVHTVLAFASRGSDYHENMSEGSMFRPGFKAVIRRTKVRSENLYTYANRNI